MSLRPSAIVRSTLQLSGLGALMLFTAAAQAVPRPALPELRLVAESRGEAAVQALAGRLPDVAAHYGMTPERLREILRRDGTSRIDPRGRLLYVEPMADAGLEHASGASDPIALQSAPYDLSQTFLLNSKPGSPRVLYLDFDGHSTSSTAWNSGAAINAQPYDTDGVPGSFSAAEREAIQKIWQRVSEDYAPFDVNVTTADPGADAIRRNSSTDTLYGSRVVITRNTFYGCTCGGVAYVGTFDYFSSTPDYYQPAWVFFDALGNGHEKFVAEAATHEAGHNLGLNHDGRSNPVEGYYSGHGSGDTGWAPIMGVGYNRNLSQWSKGEYAYANNTEDDHAIIQQNGALMRADDAGNTTAAASILGGTANNGSVVVDRTGRIEQRSDVDVFAFFAGAGTAQFNIAAANPGPNVDIDARLLDASGNLVQLSNAADTLGASFSANLVGGSYFLRIDGVGKGDLTTGYSDYGSLGQYRITGSYADTGAAAPVADASASTPSGTAPVTVFFDGSLSADSDGSIMSYAWTFGDGGSASGVNPSHTYTSAGTFTATLTVTDDQGLTASDAMSISVNAALQVISVRSISLTSSGNGKSGYQCTAAVKIGTASGTGVSGATVIGSWTGVTSASGSAVTGSTGIASLKSPKTTKRGTCTFTATNVTASGWTYDASKNVVTSASRTY